MSDVELIEIQNASEFPEGVMLGCTQKTVEAVREWAKTHGAGMVWFYQPTYSKFAITAMIRKQEEKA